jgi:CheY-like chemotaxis protein
MPASVLLVDDERFARTVYSDYLRAAGYEVELADDPDAAVRLLRERAFDVLLTDVVMPGGDGLQLLAEAKQLDPDIQVIVITALDRVGPAVRALRAHGQVALHVEAEGLRGEADRLRGARAESEEQPGPLARHRRVAGGVGRALHRVLEQQRQGVDARPIGRGGEVEADGAGAARGHAGLEPRLAPLPEQLPAHVDGHGETVAPVRQIHAHFEARGHCDDRARDVEDGLRPRGSGDGEEKRGGGRDVREAGQT